LSGANLAHARNLTQGQLFGSIGNSLTVLPPSLERPESWPQDLNGSGFHVFPAIKVNTTPQEDVFAFSAPLKMMLHPGASFYFSEVAGISVSGYLVKFTGA